MTKVLIVSPAFNEVEVLPEFLEAFTSLQRNMKTRQIEFRLLVVDDGSTDGTIDVLRRASLGQPNIIHYLSFAGNFGYQAAMIAGLCNSGSWPDAVVTMDCDLEHPIELIPKLIDAWIIKPRPILVNTIRKEASQLPLMKRILSKLFYRITSLLTGLEMTAGQADFRLWDGEFLKVMIPHLPNVGSLRVFTAWIKGKKKYLPYDQHVRRGRRSHFSFKQNWQLAVMSIIRYSDFPLRAITFSGVIGLLFSVVYGSYAIYRTVTGQTVPGWTSTVLTVIVMSCLQLVSLGIIAGYLHRLVFAKDLPPYLIHESNLPENLKA